MIGFGRKSQAISRLHKPNISEKISKRLISPTQLTLNDFSIGDIGTKSYFINNRNLYVNCGMYYEIYFRKLIEVVDNTNILKVLIDKEQFSVISSYILTPHILSPACTTKRQQVVINKPRRNTLDEELSTRVNIIDLLYPNMRLDSYVVNGILDLRLSNRSNLFVKKELNTTRLLTNILETTRRGKVIIMVKLTNKCNKVITKEWNLEKFGREEAIKLATEWRDEQLALIETVNK